MIKWSFRIESDGFFVQYSASPQTCAAFQPKDATVFPEIEPVFCKLTKMPFMSHRIVIHGQSQLRFSGAWAYYLKI